MDDLKIQLLLTGNELMVGDIIDSNSAMIAQHLLPLGASIERKVTVADDIDLLIHEIQTISQQADVLIINGGLGPTIDDLTAQALAKSCQLPLKEHPCAVNHLQEWANRRGIPLDKTNLKQAMLPQHATIIPNRTGSAVGFHLNFQQCDIYCTPGVPSELAIMLQEEVMPLIQPKLAQHQHYQVLRLHVFGLGESTLQALLEEKFPTWPKEVDIGFRASSPFLELKLTIQQKQDIELLTIYKAKLYDLLGDHILSQLSDKTPTMAEYVLTLLQENNQSITTAESCTGGLISSLLTNIAGASKSFEAGYITYSNSAKEKMLDVSNETLRKYGAVSEQVVIEMAQGALAKSDADYAIAVSGIAGPEGGTKEKPVGSVWIAWGNNKKIKTVYLCIKGTRYYFQTAVANRALDLIRRDLIASAEQPYYFN
ncbi:CinA family nicotinamide mononucleotide deamidase-related protein [Colwellia sp. 1_MG-2023]|uniref:CinA family nicotinamide mononucleotide deamidase-related protein n=1 Tax=Colwellia sp. 1_MG-2023 TaxID=3062649 RepID=UPI0026E2B4F6|nr:CinA family nicotinamide mononucleotide deamidase-related protein [Colwellia sp. 1_MG-2023]MDO6445841.1 CinA family nicotinamide mononucleotide deamidase-related protein [Colwellia sp. 1_MG-2023]